MIALVDNRLEATLRRRRLIQNRGVTDGEQSVTAPFTCEKVTGLVWMILGDVAVDRTTYLQRNDDLSYDPREHSENYL